MRARNLRRDVETESKALLTGAHLSAIERMK